MSRRQNCTMRRHNNGVSSVVHISKNRKNALSNIKSTEINRKDQEDQGHIPKNKSSVCDLCFQSTKNGLVYRCKNKHITHLSCIKKNMKDKVAFCPQCKVHIRNFEEFMEKIKIRTILYKRLDSSLIFKLLVKIRKYIKDIPEKDYIISALMEILYYIY